MTPATNARKIEVYQDSAAEYRYRAVAGNGEIVAEGESHARLSDAKRAALGAFPGLPVEVLPDECYAPDESDYEAQAETGEA